MRPSTQTTETAGGSASSAERLRRGQRIDVSARKWTSTKMNMSLCAC